MIWIDYNTINSDLFAPTIPRLDHVLLNALRPAPRRILMPADVRRPQIRERVIDIFSTGREMCTILA